MCFKCHPFVLFSFLATDWKIYTCCQKILILLKRQVHQSPHEVTLRGWTHWDSFYWYSNHIRIKKVVSFFTVTILCTFVIIVLCCKFLHLLSNEIKWSTVFRDKQYSLRGPCTLMNRRLEFIRERNSIWIQHPKQHLVCPEVTAMRHLIKPTPPSNAVHRTQGDKEECYN